MTEDWSAPTAYLRRLGDALQALCGGHRPTDKLMADWLDTEQESDELQVFCIEHGPVWAQGIGVIDAALTLADHPTEGVAHERRPEPTDVDLLQFAGGHEDAESAPSSSWQFDNDELVRLMRGVIERFGRR